MAEVHRRAQIAYCGGRAVSVSFEQGGKAIQIRPTQTRAQAPERLRCSKIDLQHRVPLQQPRWLDHGSWRHTDPYGEPKAGASAPNPSSVANLVARSCTSSPLRNLPIRQEL